MTNRKNLFAGLAFFILFCMASWQFLPSALSSLEKAETAERLPAPDVQHKRSPEPQPQPQIVINFPGSESIKGEIVAAIFDDEVSFNRRSKPVKRIKLSPSESEPAKWVVEGIAPGSYAVAAFVDLNGNSKLDKNRLGIPTERYGFSNNARGRFGPPKFEECIIHIADHSDLEIDLR